MRKTFLFTAGLFLIIVILALLKPKPAADLPVLGKVNPFQLTDADGNAFSRKSLTNKIWVADFIFTTCGGICPAMSGHMKELSTSFKAENAVNFVSISANPEQDDPEQLDLYRKHYDADPKIWFFLTGERQAIHDLAVKSFKVGSVEDPLLHSDRFILVDRNFNIRGYYTGTDLHAVEELREHINQLLRAS